LGSYADFFFSQTLRTLSCGLFLRIFLADIFLWTFYLRIIFATDYGLFLLQGSKNVRKKFADIFCGYFLPEFLFADYFCKPLFFNWGLHLRKKYFSKADNPALDPSKNSESGFTFNPISKKNLKKPWKVGYV